MQKKKAVITGASSGIGKVYAEKLAQEGYDLLLIARRADRLSDLAHQLMESYGITAEILPADLSDDTQIETVCQQIKHDRAIHVLINNAGFGTVGRIWEADDQKQMAMIRLHIHAPYQLCRAVVPTMIQQKSGIIINVSSIAGFFHSSENINYCATKAYLTSFSQSLSDEVRSYNVRVQALCPGFTYSEFHDREELEAFNREDIPQKMWMSAEDVVAESWKKRNNGTIVVIPGKINRWMVRSTNLPIYSLLRKLYHTFIKKN